MLASGTNFRANEGQLGLLHLAALFAFAACLSAFPVPWANECFYLLRLERQWNPALLANDWTFSQLPREHFVFNTVFGVSTLVLPVVTVGWIGRVVSWFLLVWAMTSVGKHYRIPLWMISASIASWLAMGQSLVGGEWALGEFEAKMIAYIFLFLAIDRILRQSTLMPAALLGLCFSFHPGVGLWGVAAALIGLLTMRQHSIASLAKIGALTALFATPGLVPLLLPGSGVSENSSGAWEYFARIRAPQQLDPSSWPKRDILTIYLLFAFNLIHAIGNRKDSTFRFLIGFQSTLCAILSLGLVWRTFGQFDLLKFMPFRHFPLFVLLLFFFHLSHAFCHSRIGRNAPVLAAIGILSLTALPGIATSTVDRMRLVYESWTVQPSSLESAMQWLKSNTPQGSTVIAPPWQRNSWWLAERALVVGISPPFDRLAEWRHRMETLGGKLDMSAGGWDVQTEEVKRHYRALTPLQITTIARSYGANYLVTDGEYQFHEVFRSGTFRVYQLTNSESQSSRAPS